MNIKILVALSTGLLTVACASSSQRAMVDNCESSRPPVKCNTGKPKDKITINTAGRKLVVAPNNVCSDAGTTIDVTVVQGRIPVTVVAVPKDATHGWVLAVNATDPTKMTIKVPSTAAEGDYDYLFITSDGRCYDPRIRIGPN